MAINITAVGGAGTHSLRKVNVNLDEDYVYFPGRNVETALSPDVTDESAWVFREVTGDLLGLDSDQVYYINTDGFKVGFSTTPGGTNIDITNFSNGLITLNFPSVFDNQFNLSSVKYDDQQAVKYVTNGDPIGGLTSGNVYFVKNLLDGLGGSSLYNFTSHQFTTGGATGRFGPTITQLRDEYVNGGADWATTYLNQGSFQGYQDWTVPTDGVYRFSVRGASGRQGNALAGLGAIVEGNVRLSRGEVITILCGQVGTLPPNNTSWPGSSGGTFVVRKNGNIPLFAAGGGSSSSSTTSARGASRGNGKTTIRGGTSQRGYGGGVDGNGAGGISAGGAGGGFFTNGGNSERGGGGQAFLNGGIGGFPAGGSSGSGGFGGGGGADGETWGGPGGAGGYSGGATNNRVGANWCGGGGSWVISTATEVATSDGQFNESTQLLGRPIADIDFNTAEGEGSVAVTLVESSVFGFVLHNTADDAAADENPIAVSPGGSSTHALIPITVDVDNNAVHLTDPHGFFDGKAVNYFSQGGSPVSTLLSSEVYYIETIDDYSFRLSTTPSPNFTTINLTAPSFETAEGFRDVIVNLNTNTFTIPNHGFLVNQPVRYRTGEQNAVLPLQNNATYYIKEVLDANTFSLSQSLNGPVLDLTALGQGTSHSFIFTVVNELEDSIYIPSHGFVSGQTVQYAKARDFEIIRLATSGIYRYVDTDVNGGFDVNQFILLDEVQRPAVTAAYPEVAITSYSSSGTTRFITTAADHGLSTSMFVNITGMPASTVSEDRRWNGFWRVTGVQSSNQFSFTAEESFNLGSTTALEGAKYQRDLDYEYFLGQRRVKIRGIYSNGRTRGIYCDRPHYHAAGFAVKVEGIPEPYGQYFNGEWFITDNTWNPGGISSGNDEYGFYWVDGSQDGAVEEDEFLSLPFANNYTEDPQLVGTNATVQQFARIDNIGTGINGAGTRLRFRNDFANVTIPQELDVSGYASKRSMYIESRGLSRRTRVYLNIDTNHDREVGDRVTVTSMEDRFRYVFNREFRVSQIIDGDEFFSELDEPFTNEIESIRFFGSNDMYVNFKQPHGWSDGGDAWFQLKNLTDNSNKIYSGEVNITDRFSAGVRRTVRTDNPHRLSTGSRFRILNFDDGEGNGSFYVGDWVVAGVTNANEFFFDTDTGSLTLAWNNTSTQIGRLRRAYFLDTVYGVGIAWRRRDGNVVTMQLDGNHDMQPGEKLRITRLTGSQRTEFEGTYTITAVPAANQISYVTENNFSIAQENIDGLVYASHQIRAFDEPFYDYAISNRELVSHNVARFVTTFEHGFAAGMNITISSMSGTNTGVFNGTFNVIEALTPNEFTVNRTTQSNVTSFTVTNRSRTSFLCDVTLNTTHNFQVGDTVTISNITGANFESFNGTHIITGVPASNRIQFVDPNDEAGTITAAAVSGTCLLESVPPSGSSISGNARLNTDNTATNRPTAGGFADLVEISTEGFNGHAIVDTSIAGLQNRASYFVLKVDDNTIRLSEDASFTQIADIEGVGVGNHSIINKSVDYVANTLIIPNHGFSLGELVEYDTGGGDPIGGLTTATPYYVIPVDGNTLQLAFSLNNANSGIEIDLQDNVTPTGTHTLRSLIRTPDGTYEISTVPTTTTFNVIANGTVPEIVKTFDPPFTVDLQQNIIRVPSHGFLTGTRVTYSANGGTALGGLTNAQDYFVIAINKDFIKLATTAENAASGVPLSITTVGAGANHSLSSAQINGQITGTGTVTTTVDSVLVNGSGTTFSKILKVGDNFRLFPPDSEEKAYFEASDVDTGNDQILVASHPFNDGSSVIFNPGSGGRRIGIARISSSGTTRSLFTSEAHGFSNGETITVEGLSSDSADDFEGTFTITFVSTSEIRYTATESFTLSVQNQDFGAVVIQAGSDGVPPAPLITNRYYYVNRIADDAVRNITARSRTNNVALITTSAAHGLQPGNVITISNITGTSPEVFNGTHTIIAIPSSTTFEFNSSGGNIANAGVSGTLTNSSSNLLSLHPTRTDALAGTNAIDLATQGSGSQLFLNHIVPAAPIVRRIAAIGSDTQVTVGRPYTTAYENVAFSYPTFLYVRPQGYSLHRPFDGGVEMSTGSGTWNGSIVRQTRKYFRYQSGKGIQTSAAVNFKPSIDIETMFRIGESNTIQVRTRRPHGLINGLFVRIDDAKDQFGVDSPVYNGTFQVTVLDSFNLTIISQQQVVEPVVYGYPRLHVTAWTNGAIRAGMFDFQNGMFFEFDGQKLYAVRRSSTQQIAGTFACLNGSEKVFGTNTAFTTQLKAGDYIVLRGQSYRIASIESDTRLTIKPEYKGASGNEKTFDPTALNSFGISVVNTATDTFNLFSHGFTQNLPVVYNSIDGDPIGGLVNGRVYYVEVVDSNSFKLKSSPDSQTFVNLSSVGSTTVHSFTPAKTGIIGTLTVDTRVPQEEWSLDPCNGTGPTGYNLDLAKIQMIYMDYSWYGAGKIRFGFKTVNGEVQYTHEFTHNNQLFESYFRSGNLPARYEVATYDDPTYIPSLFHWGTSVIMDGEFDDDKAYLFTKSSQTLTIGGTTSKTFGSTALSTLTDIINIPSHGFADGDAVQFLGIGSNGLPQSNTQNPRTRFVGTYNPYDYLINEDSYFIRTIDSNNIVLTRTANDALQTRVNMTSITKSNFLVTVDTSGNHNLSVGQWVLVYLPSTVSNYLGYVGVVQVRQVVDANTFNFNNFNFNRSAPTVSNQGYILRNVIDFLSVGNSQSQYRLSPLGSLNNTSGANYQPLISLRLSPSVSEGLTGALGDRDVINRMQLRLQEVGVQTNQLVDVKVLLNPRLNNLNFVGVETPSLVQTIEHTSNDTVSGGIQVYNFKASGQNGVEQSTNVDVSELFELSNSILGGDSVFPDGPDILTVAVARLTGQETLCSARLSWGEAQA